MQYVITISACSTIRASVLREHAKALLRKKGTAFGDFILTEFKDPILREHVVSLSVSDVPMDLQVWSPLPKFFHAEMCVCMCESQYYMWGCVWYVDRVIRTFL